jgi:hypothetical protein
LQGTEGYWASILQLTPSAIARKSSNGAGSSVVQGRLVKDRDDVDVINILHEAEALLEAAMGRDNHLGRPAILIDAVHRKL